MPISKIPDLFRGADTKGMVTDQKYLNLGAYSEEFMSNFDYSPAERVRLQEKRITTKGEAADRPYTMTTIESPKQLGRSQSTYARNDSFFEISRVRETVIGDKWYSFSKIETVSYDIIKPHSLNNSRISYYNEARKVGHFNDVLKGISTIMTLVGVVK